MPRIGGSDCGMQSEETRVNARDYLQRINQVIVEIGLNPRNWIVSKIDREHGFSTEQMESDEPVVE